MEPSGARQAYSSRARLVYDRLLRQALEQPHHEGVPHTNTPTSLVRGAQNTPSTSNFTLLPFATAAKRTAHRLARFKRRFKVFLALPSPLPLSLSLSLPYYLLPLTPPSTCTFTLTLPLSLLLLLPSTLTFVFAPTHTFAAARIIN